jgi:hypothetical protein
MGILGVLPVVSHSPDETYQDLNQTLTRNSNATNILRFTESRVRGRQTLSFKSILQASGRARVKPLSVIPSFGDSYAAPWFLAGGSGVFPL